MKDSYIFNNLWDKILGRGQNISLLALFTALLFISGCFLEKNVIFVYPFIVLIYTLINFETGMHFVFFTLGINYTLFYNTMIFGFLHPNSFITIGQILFVLIGLTQIFLFSSLKDWHKRFDVKSITLLLFMFYSIISLTYSQDKLNGIKVLANILLYAFTLLLFYNKEISLKKVFTLILITSLISFLLVYPLQKLVSPKTLYFPDRDRGPRFSGGNVYPVVLSFYMSLVFFSALYMFEKTKKWYYLLFLPVSLIISYMTLTRTTIIGLLLIFLIYFSLKYTKHLKYLIPISLVITFFLFLVGILQKLIKFFLDFILKNYARYRQDDINYLTGGRLNFWRHTLSVFLKYPAFGIGLGGITRSMEYFNLPTPHNDYVRILVELGTLGFIIFIFFIVLELIHLIKNVKHHTIPLCVFLFFLIIFFTDSPIDYNLYFTFPLFVILGLVNQKGELRSQKY